MKLARRFSLTHGFIALLAVVITLAVMIGGARYLFWNEIHETQQKQMGGFVLAVREAFYAHEDVATLNFIRMAVKDETVVFAAYTDETGRHRLVLPASFQQAVLAPGTVRLPDGRRVDVLEAPVAAGDKNVGRVSLAYDMDRLEARVRSQMAKWVGIGVVAGLCALVAAVLVSVRLSVSLVRPLKRIKAGTEQVRLGKLDKMVEVERSDEIGDLAREFNTMVAQLKELEALKRDFVAGVTHDFGTPLHAIRNALELLQEGKAGPLSDKQAEYLLMIANNTHQLTDFINNLLTTSRIEAAKMDPYLESLDLLPLAREVVALYQPQAQRKGIELCLANEDPTLLATTDVTMFRQILVNLVSNAMKYTARGKVKVELTKENGLLTLAVADTGIGIAPEHLGLIFDKFFRVRQPKDFPAQQGTGLGLAIAKGLAESLGGSIQVQSEQGRGTTFTVKLRDRTLPAALGKEA